jgi:zinc protease
MSPIRPSGHKPAAMRLSTFLLLAPCSWLLLSAQTPTPRKATSAPVPSTYKDLKYPPLKPLNLPALDPVTLPNGMRLYLVEDHELATIHGLALVRTGNLFDPAGQVGLAALTGEVMRTGGAGARTAEQIDERLDSLAATVDSSIGETSGALAFTALRDNADDVLAIFKDVMTAPAFRQDRVDRAKQQLRQSIAHRNDDPAVILHREFNSIVYGKDSPFGWALEYTHLDRIARGDLVNFHRRYFFPKNVMLALWGDFDKTQMQSRIEKLFADWTAQQPDVPPFPKIGASAHGTFLAKQSAADRSYVVMGQLGTDFRDKDCAPLEILADILGGGELGRLHKRVGTAGRLATINAVWRGEAEHPGVFQISSSFNAFQTVAALKAVNQEVATIRTSEVTDDELNAAKTRVVSRLMVAFDTRDEIMQRLILYEYFGFPRDFAAQYRKALEAVTRADVLRVAKERLDPAKMALLTVGNPAAFQEPLDSLGPPVTTIDLTIPPRGARVSTSDPASQQKGKELLLRVQKSVGGADKLATVKDYAQESTLQFAASTGGRSENQTERWIGPNFVRQESERQGGKLTLYCDGKSGWLATQQGSGALVGLQLKQVQGDLFRVFFSLLLSDRIPGRTLTAADDSTLEIGDGGEILVRLALDPETGLPQNAQYEIGTDTGTVSITENFADYRDTGGLKLPFKTSVMAGGQKYADLSVKSWQLNAGLKLADLEKRP